MEPFNRRRVREESHDTLPPAGRQAHVAASTLLSCLSCGVQDIGSDLKPPARDLAAVLCVPWLARIMLSYGVGGG